MRIKTITTQLRNDLYFTGECEHCGEEQPRMGGYDDAYWHEKVLPALRCKACRHVRGARSMTDILTVLTGELAEAIAEREQLRAASEETTEQIVEWCEAFGIPDDGSMLDMIEAHVDARKMIFSDLSAGRTKDGRIEDLPGAVSAALDAEHDKPEAADALRRYLSRLGHPADPVRLDDPDLWALCEALL